MFGAGGGTSSYREIEESDLILLWGSNARETHPIFFHHVLKAVRRGARVLELQSACPFRAFGELRLGAEPHEEPDAGIDRRVRGIVLHRALERFWAAVAREDGFRLLAGQDWLVKYLFHSRKNEHWFCATCGVRAFGVGTDTPIGRMVGVNVGCLEGLSEEALARIPITYVDGMNDRGEAPAFVAHL